MVHMNVITWTFGEHPFLFICVLRMSKPNMYIFNKYTLRRNAFNINIFDINIFSFCKNNRDVILGSVTFFISNK